MFRFGYTTTRDVEMVAWEKALGLWPAPQPENLHDWVSGFLGLDAGDALIGRPSTLLPSHKVVALGASAFWIRFGGEWNSDDPAPMGIPYQELTVTEDPKEFGFRTNPYWRLELTEDAATLLRAKLEPTR